MTIRELVNTCQNQWSGPMFGKNIDFKFDVINADEDKTYHFDIDYLNNNDWYDVQHEEVAYWSYDNGILKIGFNIWRVI